MYDTYSNGSSFYRKDELQLLTAGYYAKMAADEDMIGLVFTNASPRLAPWGGKDLLFGNNPWSIAVPTARKAIPFVLDIANSVTTAGKIRIAKKKGEKIPLGWAMNGSGAVSIIKNHGSYCY